MRAACQSYIDASAARRSAAGNLSSRGVVSDDKVAAINNVWAQELQRGSWQGHRDNAAGVIGCGEGRA